MAKEEHIFILEWGEGRTRLLYCLFDNEGRLCLADGAEAPSAGVRDGLPEDDSAAARVLGKLASELEERHQLKIQTLFCWIRGQALSRQKVTETATYNELRTRKNGYSTRARQDGFAEYLELVDVFGSESPEERCVFTVPGLRFQILEKTLLERGFFLEEMISFPRTGMAGGCGSTPAQGAELMLGILDDCSCMAVVRGDSVLDYEAFGLSTLSLAAGLSERIGISAEQAMQVLFLSVKTAMDDAQGWEESMLDFRHIMDRNLSSVREYVADELEKLAGSARQGLERRGLMSALSGRIFVFGEGSRLYSHFAFLRDILPMEAHEFRADPVLLPDASGRQSFSHLLRLAPYCLERRRLARDRMRPTTGERAMRAVMRRLLGT